MKPIIGLRYEAQTRFLRQMPRDWVLEESRPKLRWQWWRDGDVWVSVVTFLVGVWAVGMTIRGFV